LLLVYRGSLRGVVGRFSGRLNLRQTEIQNLRVPALGDEEVCRLDVAVDDSGRVRRVHRVRNLNPDRQHRLQFKWRATDAVLQRIPSRYSITRND
jgi:hypothetical protein